MTRGFWFSVFRPVENRNYIGLKKYRILYIVRLLPALMMIGVGLTISPSNRWWLAIGFFTLVFIINYAVLAVQEKISWKLFFKKNYDSPESVEYQTIKAFDDNPNAENLKKVKNLEGKNG